MDRTGNTDKHFDSKEKVNDFSRNQTGDSASRVVYVVRGSHHQPSELHSALLPSLKALCAVPLTMMSGSGSSREWSAISSLSMES